MRLISPSFTWLLDDSSVEYHFPEGRRRSLNPGTELPQQQCDCVRRRGLHRRQPVPPLLLKPPSLLCWKNAQQGHLGGRKQLAEERSLKLLSKMLWLRCSRWHLLLL